MHELRRRILLDLLRITDLLVMSVAFISALMAAGHSVHTGGLAEYLAVRIKVVNFGFFMAWLLTWHLIFKSFGLYRSSRTGVLSAEWWRIAKAVGVATLLLSLAAVVFRFSTVNSVFLLSFFCVSVIGTICARFLLRLFFTESRRLGATLRRLAIVGCGFRGAEFGKKVRQRPDFGYLLLGYIDEEGMPAPENPLHGGPEKMLGPLSQTREILEANNVDEVVITLPIASHYGAISDLIEVCEELAIDVLMPTDFFQSRLVNVSVDDSRAWPAMELRRPVPSTGGMILKRFLDFVVSLLILILLSPAFALIAIAIKLDSKGPVFFRQERVGLRRKRFMMHKFRTMEVNAESRLSELEDRNEVNGAAFKIVDDPRVTRIGRTLRRLSLDELPQFIDVLIGNMSLVGPRPLPVRDVDHFDKTWQKRRFSVKPGLTCLWQVNGRHEIEFENWMELDLQYIDNWSLAMDFDILLKTVPAVIRGNGAS